MFISTAITSASRFTLNGLIPTFTSDSPTQQSNLSPAEFTGVENTILFDVDDSAWQTRTGDPIILSLQDGTATGEWLFLQKVNSGGNRFRIFSRTSGETDERFDGFLESIYDAGTMRIALGFSATDLRVWVNGALYAKIEGNYARPSGLDTIGIGQATGGSNQYTAGTISNLKIYDKLVTDAQGRALTGGVEVLSGVTFDATKDLYILAGQSNSVGVASGTPSYTNTSNMFLLGNDMVMGAYSDPYDDDASSKIAGLDDASAAVGYAGYFADKLAGATGNDIAVCPANLSSTGLVDGGFDPDTALYRTRGTKITGLRGTAFALVNQIAMAKQFAPIRGILWGQGETDARDGESGAAYQADLTLLITEMRGAAKAGSLPVFNLGMPAYDADYEGTEAEYDAIIDAQKAVATADSNVHYFNGDTIDGASGDEIHYDLAGYEAVADLLVVQSQSFSNQSVSFGDSASIDTSTGFVGDNITYTATGLPSWASIDPATGIITGTAPDAEATSGIVVTATNVLSSDTISFDLIVTEAFDPNSVDGLRQLLLVEDTPTLAGVVADERTGLGTDRPYQPKRARSFDGTNDYVEVNGFVQEAYTSGSASLWFRADTSQATNARLLSIGNNNNRIDFYLLNSSTLIMASTGSGGSFSFSTDGVNDGAWRNACLTWTTNEVKGYLDGVSIGTDFNSTTQLPIGEKLVLGNFVGGGAFVLSGALFDARVYNKVLTTEEITHIRTFGVSGTDPTTANLVAQYKLEGNHPTIEYDSSGNGNDGTKTNMTDGGVYEGTDVPYSFQNEVGYTLSGSTYIPRDESDTANDVLGNALQFSGKAPNPGQAINSPCGTFDGVNDQVNIGAISDLQITGDVSFGGWVKVDTIDASFQRIVSCGTDGENANQNILWDVFISATSGSFGYIHEYGSGSNEIYTYAFTPTTGTWYHVFIVRDVSEKTAKLYVNGEFQETFTYTNQPTGGILSQTTLGNAFGSTISYLDGNLCDIRVYNAVKSDAEVAAIASGGADDTGVVGWWPLSENSGATAHDVSGNDNHGTITNATTTTGTGFWANTQDVFHWSLAKGFTALSGVEVPALADGTADADGNTITNPAGAHHNSGITDLTLTDGTWSFNDARTNPHFRRGDDGDGNADRFLSYDDALSGTDLTNIQTYTEDA